MRAANPRWTSRRRSPGRKRDVVRRIGRLQMELNSHPPGVPADASCHAGQANQRDSAGRRTQQFGVDPSVRNGRRRCSSRAADWRQALGEPLRRAAVANNRRELREPVTYGKRASAGDPPDNRSASRPRHSQGQTGCASQHRLSAVSQTIRAGSALRNGMWNRLNTCPATSSVGRTTRHASRTQTQAAESQVVQISLTSHA